MGSGGSGMLQPPPVSEIVTLPETVAKLLGGVGGTMVPVIVPLSVQLSHAANVYWISKAPLLFTVVVPVTGGGPQPFGPPFPFKGTPTESAVMT
jgi:hypothetical protein